MAAPHPGSRPSRAGPLLGLFIVLLGLGGWILSDSRLKARPASLGPPTAAAVATAEGFTRDPAGVLQLARREADPERRTRLVRTSLQNWAAVDPEAAGTWVLGLPDEERLDAATAVLLSLAGRPASAVALAQRLCREDPVFVREHGGTLVTILAGTGQFDTALRFAELGGPERSEWLTQALQLWTRQDPVRAAKATLSHADGEGFTVVATAWAGRDPAGLADFVLQPRAATSDLAPVEAALQSWLEQNPETVTLWLDRL